jgi:hypothetical protein
MSSTTLEKLNMFVPPLTPLLRGIGLTPRHLDAKEVPIPIDVLKLLLQIALANSDFNEAGYLRANPDVATALRDGSVDNAFLHYVSFGYFEGRLGATPDVDESFYLRAYPDVASAVKAKQVSSGKEHFELVGAGEGRSPSADYAHVAAQWKKAVGAG